MGFLFIDQHEQQHCPRPTGPLVQGRDYELDSVIDLDGCLGEPGDAPNFHLLLAQAAGIDPYSYLYEILESHEIAFSGATGVAVRSCRDGRFDWRQFERDRAEERDWQAVRVIVDRILGPRDLDPDLDQKAALRAVHRAGKTGDD